MLYRKLGSSDLQVSVIAFGAWQIGDSRFWGEQAHPNPDRAVGAAIDGGVTLFDTAEAYGDGGSEQALGRALQGRRDKVLIADKVSPEHCTPEGIRQSCENSLRRLDTDRIDLYQIHWPFRHTSFEDACAALERLKEEGKIREIGVSNFGPCDLDAWMRAGTAASNQIGYNLLFRAPENEMIPACIKHHVGVLTYMPLMQGLLTGRYCAVEDIPMPRRRTRHFSCRREGTRHGEAGHEETLMNTVEDLQDFADAVNIPMPVLCLSWIIAQPGVASVILGARDAAQLQANLPAADLDIGPAAVAQLNEFSYPLKIALGACCDMWESDENSRIR